MTDWRCKLKRMFIVLPLTQMTTISKCKHQIKSLRFGRCAEQKGTHPTNYMAVTACGLKLRRHRDGPEGGRRKRGADGQRGAKNNEMALAIFLLSDLYRIFIANVECFYVRGHYYGLRHGLLYGASIPSSLGLILKTHHITHSRYQKRIKLPIFPLVKEVCNAIAKGYCCV